jgi:hypothetical protein
MSLHVFIRAREKNIKKTKEKKLHARIHKFVLYLRRGSYIFSSLRQCGAYKIIIIATNK